MPRHLRKALLVALATLAVAGLMFEGWARWSGFTDFPLYDADTQLGYLPKPSQSGTFARRYDWQFNSLGMGAREFAPSAGVDVLLLGDSIVHGGVRYRQQDRLGPQLADTLGQAVWPVSATSWRLPNALAYIERYPAVARQSDRFIFLLNSGDFRHASSWSCADAHPRSRPMLASLYVLRTRVVSGWEPCGETPPGLAVPPRDWRQVLQAFLASEDARSKPVEFFLYPHQAELSGDGRALRRLEAYAGEIARQASAPVSVYSVARDPRWNSGLYGPDGIHPTVPGTKILAGIIARPSPAARLAR